MSSKVVSTQFKQQAVEKFLTRGNKSVEQIAKNIGVSIGSLYRWRDELGRVKMTKNKPLKDWTPEQKLEAFIKTSSMNEHELGEYLRKNGLHSSDLERFKQELLEGLKSAGRPKLDPKLVELRKENKKLQKQISKKDKALAEYSARVILLKKSHEIWGEPEEDE